MKEKQGSKFSDMLCWAIALTDQRKKNKVLVNNSWSVTLTTPYTQ